MKFGIHTLDDIQVEGKIVLARVDINQAIDHKTNTFKDITRIWACFPTVSETGTKDI